MHAWCVVIITCLNFCLQKYFKFYLLTFDSDFFAWQNIALRALLPSVFCQFCTFLHLLWLPYKSKYAKWEFYGKQNNKTDDFEFYIWISYMCVWRLQLKSFRFCENVCDRLKTRLNLKTNEANEWDIWLQGISLPCILLLMLHSCWLQTKDLITARGNDLLIDAVQSFEKKCSIIFMKNV